jgi:very-short-patch-repair endonuclease
VNGIVEGHEVDAHWPGRALVVELDSFEYHRTRASFEADRRRDAALLVAERPVLRITQRRLRSEPERLRAELSALLA